MIDTDMRLMADLAGHIEERGAGKRRRKAPAPPGSAADTEEQSCRDGFQSTRCRGTGKSVAIWSLRESGERTFDRVLLGHSSVIFSERRK